MSSKASKINFRMWQGAQDKAINRLTQNKHRQLPKSANESLVFWVRIALQVLHDFSRARARKAHWEVVQEGKQPTRIEPSRRLPERDKKRRQVELKPNELKVVDELVGAMKLRTRAAALETALHFLWRLSATLEKRGALAKLTEVGSDGAESDPDLGRHAESLVGTAAPVWEVDGEAFANADGDEPFVAQAERSESADLFFSVLWCTTAFGRTLAQETNAITSDAQSSQEDKGKLIKPSKVADRERHYYLPTLLKEFMKSSDEVLKYELEQHRLIPPGWKKQLIQLQGTLEPRSDPKAETRRRERFDSCRTLGMKAIEGYLSARFEGLELDDLLSSPVSSDENRAPWRDWTRSRHVGEHREMPAPIEWIAVLLDVLQAENSKRGERSTDLGAHDLQVLVLEAFGLRSTPNVLRFLARACLTFNEIYYPSQRSISDHQHRESEVIESLEDLLKALRGEATDDVHANLARVAYVFLNIAGFVRPVFRWKAARLGSPRKLPFASVETGIRSAAPAELSELRARVFGAQTVIQGLHRVLRGGIVPEFQRGSTWLVHGPPGSGKSTFTLAIASDAARRGTVAVVLCADERRSVILQRLHTFGLRDDSRCVVLEDDAFRTVLQGSGEIGDDAISAAMPVEPTPPTNLREDAGPRLAQPIKGILAIIRAPQGATALASSLQDLGRRAKHHLARFEDESRIADLLHTSKLLQLRRRWSEVSVFADSVDGLELEGVDSDKVAPNMRKRIDMLVRTFEEQRIWAVLICGSTSPFREALSYQTDTVIELGSEDAGLYRRIRIPKSRRQDADSGYHDLRLIEGRGVAIYPNLRSTQRAMIKRRRRHPDSEHVVRVPSQLHGPLGQVWTFNRRALPMFRRGGALLLYGPPQTGKELFVLNLLCQRAQLREFLHWPLGANGSILIVSFHGRSPDEAQVLANSSILSDLWRKNVSNVRVCTYGPDSTLRAAEITHDLTQQIHRMRRSALPLAWIVFFGIESLKTNLPAVAAEAAFWPTILSITASEDISTIYVVSSEAHPFVHEHRVDMDYVVRSDLDKGKGGRAIRLEKSLDPPPPGGYPRLALTLKRGSSQRGVRGASRGGRTGVHRTQSSRTSSKRRAS